MNPLGDGRSKGNKAPESASSRGPSFDLYQAPSHMQLAVCITAVVILYMLYSYFQELIFRVEGFTYGWYLILVQFVLYSSLGYIDSAVSGESVRKAPMLNYVKLACLMVLTMILINLSLVYLNYPSQAFFKNGKLFFVMVAGVALLGRRYSIWEGISAILLTAAIVFLAWGNTYSDPVFFSFSGIFIICCALLSEGVIANYQEKTLLQYQVAPREMSLYTHLVGAGLVFIICLFVGQLGPAFSFCLVNPKIYVYMLFFSFCGYSGANVVYTMIKLFGAFMTTSVTSIRKIVTAALPFFLFVKPFTFMYLFATLLGVFGVSALYYSRNSELFEPSLRKWLAIKRKSNDTSPPAVPMNGSPHTPHGRAMDR